MFAETLKNFAFIKSLERSSRKKVCLPNSITQFDWSNEHSTTQRVECSMIDHIDMNKSRILKIGKSTLKTQQFQILRYFSVLNLKMFKKFSWNLSALPTFQLRKKLVSTSWFADFSLKTQTFSIPHKRLLSFSSHYLLLCVIVYPNQCQESLIKCYKY